MTQGELEKIPAKFEKIMRQLEIRIMEDMVRRIKENGFSTASADWQFTRLKQLGMSEEQIKKWVREALQATDKEIEKIYSDETYQEYMKQARGYEIYGKEQIPFEENVELQQLIEAVKQQTAEEFQNITGSMGFVKEASHGAQQVLPLNEFYQTTLDNAVMDIHSGAFSYSEVIGRTINDMTKSGLRWIDYESGWHNRVPVAARRAVMTGFRQVQGKINEQTARDLHTDSYEVTVHIGARPTHQVWEGRVWTMEQLKTVCGLGTGPGLHGWNCYHDYNAFIPGVSVRTYTDEQLQQIHDEENEKKEYLGKEYTTYEALQRQRQLETMARKYREDVHLLEEAIKDVPDDQATLLDDEIEAKKSRYQGTLQEYKDFSKKMGLPMQKERIYQDGLKVKMEPKEEIQLKKKTSKEPYFDMTAKFFNEAAPGKGTLTLDNNITDKDKETCEWLLKTFGGDIHCLEENSQLGKMPDAIWNGIFWEFKSPTTKNAIDDRIRQANKQLMEALLRDSNPEGERGIIINITDNTLSEKDATEEIINRCMQRKKGPTTIIIRKESKALKVIRLK